MMFTHFERVPKWHSLPRLFPLRYQRLVEGELGTIQQVFDAASTAPDFEAFVGNLLQMFFRQLGNGDGALRSWDLYDFYAAQGMMATQFRNSGPAMLSAIQPPPAKAPVSSCQFR